MFGGPASPRLAQRWSTKLHSNLVTPAFFGITFLQKIKPKILELPSRERSHDMSHYLQDITGNHHRLKSGLESNLTILKKRICPKSNSKSILFPPFLFGGSQHPKKLGIQLPSIFLYHQILGEKFCQNIKPLSHPIASHITPKSLVVWGSFLGGA